MGGVAVNLRALYPFVINAAVFKRDVAPTKHGEHVRSVLTANFFQVNDLSCCLLSSHFYL